MYSVGVSTVDASAVSVDHSTPALRVTWRTAIPSQCVTSVKVEFRTQSSGPPALTNTTNSTSQTEVIQTGLQCGENYFVIVVVSGATSNGVAFERNSNQVEVRVRGKELWHEI